MNKIFIIIRIVLVAVLVVILSAALYFLINNKIAIYYKVSKTLVFNETYNETFETVDINAKAADVYLYNSNDNTFTVKYYTDNSEYEIKSEDNILKIVDKSKGCKGFCLNFKANKIEVYIPSDYDKNIIINNSYGDVHSDSFKESNIQANLDFGDIKIGDFKVANITNDCGDIKVGNVDTISVENNLGDVKINSINNHFNISADMGDIKIDKINILADSIIANDMGDIKIGKTNEINITAKTSLGDIDINKNYNDSEITLNITNSMGDIEVNN